jgi:hypothetical protein
MMNLKALIHWFHDYIRNYNLFMPEENDYNDDDNEPQEPATVLRHQKYKTWLYLVFLIGK